MQTVSYNLELRSSVLHKNILIACGIWSNVVCCVVPNEFQCQNIGGRNIYYTYIHMKISVPWDVETESTLRFSFSIPFHCALATNLKYPRLRKLKSTYTNKFVMCKLVLIWRCRSSYCGRCQLFKFLERNCRTGWLPPYMLLMPSIIWHFVLYHHPVGKVHINTWISACN